MALQVVSLNTALEIREAAQTFFPSSHLSKVQENPLHVDLKLGPTIPLVHITTAVDKFRLFELLQEIALARITAKQNDAPLVLPPVNPTRFSITAPLSGWFQYQRILYIKSGKRCEDAIKAYLESRSANPMPAELNALGFAPDQIEGHLGEDDIFYFRRVVADLAPNDTKIVNLRGRYPQTTLHLATIIETERLAQPNENRYELIHGQLQRRVIGQRQASEQMASILSRTLTGKNSVFLFVGPTGTGKTELAKAAAALKNNQIIIVNMQGYSESHSVSALIGSPPGYIGSTSKPQLAKSLEACVNAITHVDDSNITVNNIVFLLDEIEKAHSDIKQSLLTLLDEGYCIIRYTKDVKNESGHTIGQDNLNVKYTLINSIIIATSNLCTDTVLAGFQHRLPPEEIIAAFKAKNKLLQLMPNGKSFSDEFLARFNAIPFGPVPRGTEFQRLIEIKLSSFLKKTHEEIGCKEINIEDQQAVLRFLEEKLYGEGVDIRRVEKYFDSKIRNLIDQKRHSWGDIKRVKITLYLTPTNNELMLKVSVYSPLADLYIEIPREGPYSIELIDPELAHPNLS